MAYLIRLMCFSLADHGFETAWGLRAIVVCELPNELVNHAAVEAQLTSLCRSAPSTYNGTEAPPFPYPVLVRMIDDFYRKTTYQQHIRHMIFRNPQIVAAARGQVPTNHATKPALSLLTAPNIRFHRHHN